MDSNQTQQDIGSAIITAAFIVGACILFAGAIANGTADRLDDLVTFLIAGIFLTVGVIRITSRSAQKVVGHLKQELDKD